MEVRTAGEIAHAVQGGGSSRDFVTDHSSQWVRKASVEAELEKIKEMLREASAVIYELEVDIHRRGEVPVTYPRNRHLRELINKYLGEVPRG